MSVRNGSPSSFPLRTGRSVQYRAQTNVVILSPADHSQATGDEATYHEATGRLALTGQAQWQDDELLMKARTLEYDRTNNVFSAQDDAYLKMRLSAVGRPKALGGSTGNSASASALTNQFIEVNCQGYDYKNEWLTFRHDVKGRLLEGDTLQGTVNCESVGLKFHSNRLERVELHQKVRADQLPLGPRNQARVGRTLTCESLEADLSPDGYIRHLVVRTNVLARQMDWLAGSLVSTETTFAANIVTADFFPHTNAVAVAVADGNVVAQQDHRTASGNQAVYTATNDLLVLHGDARLVLDLGVVFTSPSFNLRPFQRWLREGEVGAFGLPVLPPRKTESASTRPPHD